MDDPKKTQALKELLYKMADDQLIIGHRNSEWTGLGPVLEEDIAFSSIAQDKIGHARNIYTILHQLGEAEPDEIAFHRTEKDFRCCHLVEMPIGEYDFSLIRHFLFDHSELIRFSMLAGSSFQPLADLAIKYRGEIKYHVFHANTWVQQLAKANEESRGRLQSALNDAFPLALGIFEQSEYEDIIISEGIFEGEEALKASWLKTITSALKSANLEIPKGDFTEPSIGGRNAYHTEYLKPMLTEMTEVYQLDPQAEW
ncbi:MAG: 1,2-phenylacetyl-CoA epoxidase subunit PaaC [Bacteroidia bacterium]